MVVAVKTNPRPSFQSNDKHILFNRDFPPSSALPPVAGNGYTGARRPAIAGIPAAGPKQEAAVITISISLKGDLASLTPPPRAPHRILTLPEPASVKDAVESLGVPHTEIDLLLIGNRPTTWTMLVENGDHVEVHPVAPPHPPQGEFSDTWDAHRLQPRPLERDRFVCDQHLGKLARLLRMMGCDVLYDRAYTAERIAAIAAETDRAVLTCGHGLLKRREVACGLLLRSRNADDQLTEVIRRFRIAGAVRLFGRCSLCNGPLEPIAEKEAAPRVPERTRAWRHEYRICPTCDRIYWEGSHTERIRARIAAAMARAAAAGASPERPTPPEGDPHD